MNNNTPRVGTVGDQIRLRHAVTLYCARRECRHSKTIDLEAVVAKFGRDLKLQAMLERAVCAACGAHWPELDLTLSPLVVKDYGNGR